MGKGAKVGTTCCQGTERRAVGAGSAVRKDGPPAIGWRPGNTGARRWQVNGAVAADAAALVPAVAADFASHRQCYAAATRAAPSLAIAAAKASTILPTPAGAADASVAAHLRACTRASLRAPRAPACSPSQARTRTLPPPVLRPARRGARKRPCWREEAWGRLGDGGSIALIPGPEHIHAEAARERDA